MFLAYCIASDDRYQPHIVGSIFAFANLEEFEKNRDINPAPYAHIKSINHRPFPPYCQAA
jgi:hypothetical protein